MQADLPFDDGAGLAHEAAGRLSDWDPGSWPVADGWGPVVARFLATPSAERLARFMRARLQSGVAIYPARPLHALALTPPERVKVVIVGQDPYHGPGQAHGLAFSVPVGVRIPPSLRNILSEVVRGCGPVAEAPTVRGPVSGSLEPWARQGVLLLNTCLSVERGQPESHCLKGWEVLTDEIIKLVCCSGRPVVFLLWGARAQSKRALLEQSATGPLLALSANHPSPLSARRKPVPFMGCGHFEQANAFLTENGQSPIDWLDVFRNRPRQAGGDQPAFVA
ncbi:MAG: uracil-DNA glycosylase [Betaproteobacteria bacterium]|nr:uracil-DNA glycosylase [Betaproteobacteria bacterium]